MESGSFRSDFVEAAQKEASFLAQKVGRMYNIDGQEQEDIEHDLILAAMMKSDQFDPTISKLKTFIRILMQNELQSWIRKRQRRHQKAPVTRSLNEVVTVEGQDVNFHETLDHAKCMADRGIRIPDPYVHIDMQLDIEEGITRLDKRKKEIAERLPHESKKNIGISLNVSRETIYREVSGIKDVFTDLGLQIYQKTI